LASLSRLSRSWSFSSLRELVAILATPGVQLLDVSGPLDVFAEANVQAGTHTYQLRVFGSVPGAIRSSSGVRLMTDAVIGNNLSEKVDTLLVASAPNLTEALLDARVIDWLRDVIPSVRRYGSICRKCCKFVVGPNVGVDDR
jgi:transcriptional regulator GlxA family with amidase domain